MRTSRNEIAQKKIDTSGMFNRSLEKGLRVLLAFDRGQRSLSLSQIISITGLEKSAAQRFTYTLVSLGYLKKDQETRHYSLSPRVLALGASYIRTNPLVDRATPYLLEWNKKYEENVYLAELDGYDIIHISRFRCRDVVSTEVGIGSCFPWYIASLGQAIVAFLPEKESEEMVKNTKFIRYASQTIMDKKKIYAKLRSIRNLGYSLTYRESFENDISIAAPVFGSLGTVIAAVGTGVLATNWTVENARNSLAPPIVELAQALSTAYQGSNRAINIKS